MKRTGVIACALGVVVALTVPGMGDVGASSSWVRPHVTVKPQCFVRGTRASLKLEMTHARPHARYLEYLFVRGVKDWPSNVVVAIFGLHRAGPRGIVFFQVRARTMTPGLWTFYVQLANRKVPQKARPIAPHADFRVVERGAACT